MTWVFEDVPEADPKELELEAQYAELFLRAGGHITYKEWLELDPVDAMALVLAGDRLKVQQHVDTVTASKGPEGITRVYAQVDGGELYRRMNLRAAVDRAARRLRAQASD